MTKRYVTQALADEMRQLAAFEWCGTHFQTFNIQNLDWTEWYAVPDDDPRVNTVETSE